MKKKIIVVLLSSIMLMLCACNQTEQNAKSADKPAGDATVEVTVTEGTSEGESSEVTEAKTEDNGRAYGEVTEDFYFEIYRLGTAGAGDVPRYWAEGAVFNSPIYVGCELDILTADGKRLPVRVESFDVWSRASMIAIGAAQEEGVTEEQKQLADDMRYPTGVPAGSGEKRAYEEYAFEDIIGCRVYFTLDYDVEEMGSFNYAVSREDIAVLRGCEDPRQ